MYNIIKRIDNINSNYITLYTCFDKNTVIKHIGKIPGEIDADYVEFLKGTNGASILDYCFFGVKNNKLGGNVYNIMTELWLGDNDLALRFWGIAASSTGEYFGYLDKKNKSGGHYIGYYSSDKPGKVYLVASSFSIFMNKFITQIECELSRDSKIIGLNNNDWFMNIKSLITNDSEISDFVNLHKGTEYLSIIMKNKM
ncbi:SMI1/KNR4 family protein [Citrobacter freundii]|uniref:SMI1/KNR4 family protein n=1 Tax=Citrobacter freundii TaxID=546 RepID=UPI0019000791|nr:SMI1/KNR4 family protein [Citrobacter freundii]MBJ9179487.1 SMI1/KNR4 family protein [Citrobacter freundii]